MEKENKTKTIEKIIWWIFSTIVLGIVSASVFCFIKYLRFGKWCTW